MKHRGKVGIMVPRPVFRSLMELPSELRRGRAVGDCETMWQPGDSSCCGSAEPRLVQYVYKLPLAWHPTRSSGHSMC